ncbi:MAG: tetratricopeptide repeat protein [Planctomycetota bacterium]|jgi:tetratricopeptide (TPR) repeat protein
MSKLLEIFGKGITVNTAEVIWHWLSRTLSQEEPSAHTESLLKILDHLANREIVQSEEKTRAYLSEFPDCILGRMAAAAGCLMQNDLKETLKQVQSVYWRQPSNTMALYVMGYCHERLGQIEQAVEFYQDCVKFKSYLQLPRQRMAAIYLKEGRIDRAVREYEILTSEHPDDISAIILLGYLYLASHKLSQAVDTFNLGIISHPDNFMDSQRDDEIQSLIDSGMYEQALETIKFTIEQMGPSQDLLIRMGDLYSQWERLDEAIVCYEHAIQVQPDSLEATIKLGTHYLRYQRFSLAAEQFNRASEINDQILDAYMGLALAQKLSDEQEQAMQTLSLASSIHKNSVLLYSEAATLQFQSVLDEKNNTNTPSDKKPVSIDDVIRAYQQQIEMHKKSSDTHYKYGILMMGENNLPVAISTLQNAISLNPTNYRALYKLIISIYDNCQKQKAIELLSEPDLTGASMFEQYYQMTMLYADKNEFANALKRLNVINATGSYKSVEVRADIEDMLETLGVIDRSAINWERINETSQWLLGMNKKDSIH